MINHFLQFLKKQRLAILFARAGCLSTIRRLPSMGFVSGIAAFFSREKNGNEEKKLTALMEKEQNPLLNVFITELSCRLNLFPPTTAIDSPLDGIKNISREDADFYYDLFRNIIRRSPRLRPLYNSFCNRCGMLRDKRLYAAEVEKLLEKTASLSAAVYEVDWNLTTRDEIFITHENGCHFKDSLTQAEQTELFLLWGSLFFEKETFPLFWANVVVDSRGKVNFFNIDSLQNADCALKNFFIKYLQRKTTPSSFEEHRLVSSFLLLRKFCPDINPGEIWEEYFRQAPFEEKRQIIPDEKYLESLKQTEFGIGLSAPVKTTDPRSIAWLLDSRREERQRRRRSKSSIKLFLLLLIIVLLAYRLF